LSEEAAGAAIVTGPSRAVVDGDIEAIQGEVSYR